MTEVLNLTWSQAVEVRRLIQTMVGCGSALPVSLDKGMGKSMFRPYDGSGACILCRRKNLSDDSIANKFCAVIDGSDCPGNYSVSALADIVKNQI